MRRKRDKRRQRRQARNWQQGAIHTHTDSVEQWKKSLEIAKAHNDPKSGFSPHSPTPRTDGQAYYIQAIEACDVVLCDGPAGSGKTHIAVGMAATAMRKRETGRIVMCRPAVEAGKSIGYLPGDMEAKLGPYLKPLYDELGHYVTEVKRKVMLEKGELEICPLSMMRGRTFRNAYVIVDEAQNATESELEMVLTRLGEDSTMILVGDTNQSDLPWNVQGGFGRAINALSDLDGVAVCKLTDSDIVRHKLIGPIIKRLNTMKRQHAAKERGE